MNHTGFVSPVLVLLGEGCGDAAPDPRPSRQRLDGEGAGNSEIDPDGARHARSPEDEIEARLRVASRSRDVHLLEQDGAAGFALTPVAEYADAGIVATNKPPASRAASRVHAPRVQCLAAYGTVGSPVLGETRARGEVEVRPSARW